MFSALAFALWSYIQPLPAEVAHSTYSAGQTLVGWAHGFRSREVIADNCTTRYLEGGHGETLVLLHGAGVSKEVWLLMAPYLFERYHFVIPDLPGHGQSCRDINRDFRIEGMSSWLEAFVNVLQLGRFHLVGHSIGGAVGALYAHGHQSRVSSLTLVAPAGIEKVPAQQSQLTPFMQELVTTGRNRLLIDDVSDFERVLSLAVKQRPLIWLTWLGSRFLAWEYLRNQEHLDHIIKGVMETRREFQAGEKDFEGMIQGVTMPAQVIWGEDDQVMHVAGADIIATKRPDMPIHRLPGVGHGAMLEVPQEFAELIDQFIHSQNNELISSNKNVTEGLHESDSQVSEVESQPVFKHQKRTHSHNKRSRHLLGFPRHNRRC